MDRGESAWWRVDGIAKLGDVLAFKLLRTLGLTRSRWACFEACQLTLKGLISRTLSQWFRTQKHSECGSALDRWQAPISLSLTITISIGIVQKIGMVEFEDKNSSTRSLPRADFHRTVWKESLNRIWQLGVAAGPRLQNISIVAGKVATLHRSVFVLEGTTRIHRV